MGRRDRGSGLRSALAAPRRFPVDLDQLDEVVTATILRLIAQVKMAPNKATDLFPLAGDIECINVSTISLVAGEEPAGH
jgi:hypothetical protein